MLHSEVKKQLVEIVGPDRFQDDPESLVSHSYDGYVAEGRPEAVLFPVSTAEVSRIMQIANGRGIPVTARGAGTGLSGGAIPAAGGLVLCFAKMNRILAVNTRDRYAIVQPGVINAQLQKVLKKEGFFYPPDPASFGISTIGGNVAENAGGPRCLKYGVTVDYVLGLEVVLASGKIIRFGSRNVKDVTGYRLSSLFCGAEGTLGIVTEITVRVAALPESYRTVLAVYDDIELTANTVADIIGAGIVPAAMELMDHIVVNLVEDANHLGLPRSAEGVLLIEVDGVREAVEKEMGRIVEKAWANGAIDVKEARTETEREALWTARRSAHGVLARLAPNCMTEDATVPVSNVPKMIKGVQEIAEKYKLRIGILAHAGDGNMHPIISTDMRDTEEWIRVEAASQEIFELAARLDGTLSGEHGVGLAKSKFLPLFMDSDTREFMATIKKAVDPNNILNPGKFV